LYRNRNRYGVPRFRIVFAKMMLEAGCLMLAVPI
jgi:hypothetical protein